MPLSEDQIRANAKAYAAVHGRSTASKASKAKKGKKQRTGASAVIRGARAGFTPDKASGRDVWGHHDLAR